MTSCESRDDRIMRPTLPQQQPRRRTPLAPTVIILFFLAVSLTAFRGGLRWTIFTNLSSERNLLCSTYSRRYLRERDSSRRKEPLLDGRYMARASNPNGTSSSSSSSENNIESNTTAAAASPHEHARHNRTSNTQPTSTSPDASKSEEQIDTATGNDAQVEISDVEVKEELQQKSVASRVEHSEDEDGDGEEDHDHADGKNATNSTMSSNSNSSTTGSDSKSNRTPQSSGNAIEKKTELPADSSSSTTAGNTKSEEEIEEELAEEEAKVRRVSGFGAALGLVATIFTAYQMSENPDGIYAATCRLVLTMCNLVLRLVLAPCHKCCPSFLAPSGAHYRHSYGHVPATLDYGYRDPSLELS